MPSSPRILRRVLLLLILGAATTIATTWALAAWRPHSSLKRFAFPISKARFPAATFVEAIEYRAQGMCRRTYYDLVVGTNDVLLCDPCLAEMTFDYDDKTNYWGGTLSQVQELHWGYVHQGPDYVYRIDDARGWPFLAAWCSLGFKSQRGGDLITAGGIPIAQGNSARGDLSNSRALPYLPIWRGFLLNSVFYSILWLILILLYRIPRNSLRRRKGRCPTCAYDLTATGGRLPGCPECGWNRNPDFNS